MREGNERRRNAGTKGWSEGITPREVDAIVLGGNTIRAQEFLEKGDLDYRLREKVAETIIPVSVIDETGLYQAVKEASRILKETEIYAERQAWDAFMGDLMKGMNTVTYGKKEVYEALRQGRAEVIMVTEKIADQSDELYDDAANYGTELLIFSDQFHQFCDFRQFNALRTLYPFLYRVAYRVGNVDPSRHIPGNSGGADNHGGIDILILKKRP